MARDIWAETEEEITGEYTASNKADPIPEGTECLSCIEGAEWHSFDGSTHKIINLKWRVQGGDYDDRVFFQKIKVKGEDPSSQFYKEDKQDKTIAAADKTLRNIDKNAGGFVYGLKREPTDAELKKFLIGSSMIVALGEFNKNQFVRGVKPAPDAPAPKPASKTVPKPNKDNGFEADSEDISF